MTHRQRELVGILAELAKRKHAYCEDSWYSCPKDPEGCSNDCLSENECNCGADDVNRNVDNIMRDIQELDNE